MSDSNKKTWSGHPADFDKVYEWAGKANVMEERGNEDDEKSHKLSVFDPTTGWVEAKPGDKLVKDALGYITLESKDSKAGEVADATKKAEAAAKGSETQVPSGNETPVPDPIGPGTDKETKDSPETSGIETKPAINPVGTEAAPGMVGTVGKVQGGDQVSAPKPASDPADVAANSGTAASTKAAKAGK